MPQLVVVDVPPELGHAEPDPEIQELLAASPGLNLGMDFLPGSLPFTTPAEPPVDPRLAADVVWFDTLVTNVDRTHRNPNLLLWHGKVWLIDHGAAFFRQHGGRPLAATASEAVPMLAEPPVDPRLAADVVWFDTLVTNVDRTHRNPNLLLWHGKVWLIDHGAAFFRQHRGRPLAATASEAVPMLAEHVLLGVAGPIGDADERLAERALAAIDGAVALVPEIWLGPDPAARRTDPTPRSCVCSRRSSHRAPTGSGIVQR